jgi:hypothetical protein
MVVGVFVILLLISQRDPFFMPTDLFMWGDDANTLKVCLQQSWLAGCPQLSKLAIGYLANSALLQPMLGPDGNPVAGVAVLQTAALCLPVLALIANSRRLRHGLTLSALYLVLLLLTPIPTFYIPSGSLEVQSGAFFGLAILLGLQKLKQPERPLQWFSNLFVLAGCLYKDPNAITFSASVVLAWLLSRGGWSRLRQLALLWGPGVLGAMVISPLWNLFRYHSLLPMGYVEEATLNRPSIGQALFSLWGLFLSPNGGFVVFWGAAFAVLILVKLFGQRWQWQWPGLDTWMPLTFLLAGVSSMALWWSPFGWVSWGARLSVPFCLAALIAAVGLLEEPLHWQGWSRDQRTAITTVAASVGALILLSRSSPYVALGYTRPHARFFIPPPSAVKPTKTPRSKSCTERLFAEMKTQKNPHPNPLVRMWRTKVFWHCLEEGMRTDPTR